MIDFIGIALNCEPPTKFIQRNTGEQRDRRGITFLDDSGTKI